MLSGHLAVPLPLRIPPLKNHLSDTHKAQQISPYLGRSSTTAEASSYIQTDDIETPIPRMLHPELHITTVALSAGYKRATASTARR